MDGSTVSIMLTILFSVVGATVFILNRLNQLENSMNSHGMNNHRNLQTMFRIFKNYVIPSSKATLIQEKINQFIFDQLKHIKLGKISAVEFEFPTPEMAALEKRLDDAYDAKYKDMREWATSSAKE